MCTHVSYRMPILGDSHVTLVPHPLLHLITLADGKAKGFEAGGRDGKNKCQMDISACRKGQKTLRPSAMRAHEAGTSCAYSLCAGCINWYQFRSQRRACASIPDGHPEMWFPSKRRLVFTDSVCLAELALCVERPVYPSPHLTRNSLLCTDTGPSPYTIKPFRGLGEVRK